MSIKELEEKKKFENKAWLIYRYLSQNPSKLASGDFQEFYRTIEKYFSRKFWCGTEEKTIEGLQDMFKYESEQPILINSEIIALSILEYKQNPELLETAADLAEKLKKRLLNKYN